MELAALLSRLHHRTLHHLSASECETMSVADPLGLVDAEDQARWAGLRLTYTDPLGAPWLRASIAAGYAGVGNICRCAAPGRARCWPTSR